MAIDEMRLQLRQIIAVHMGIGQRYRCMIFQATDLTMLSLLRCELTEVLAGIRPDPVLLEGCDQFDDRGALACTEVIAHLQSQLSDKYVVLSGPLHFLDYWSASLRAAFWSHLATITREPGLIVLDTPHESELDDTFTILGRIAGTEVRYLKSRLAATQDRVV